jgi:hypothetical protein
MSTRFLFLPSAIAIVLGSLFLTSMQTASTCNLSRPVLQGDSIPNNYYISDSFFAPYSLKSSSKKNHTRTWMNPDTKGMYKTMNDIRYRYASAEQAAEDFESNLQLHSEGAQEIHPAIKIPGTSHLHIYKESKKMKELNKAFGLSDLRFYYFLFLVDNVYIKVFLSVDQSVSIKEASVFAVEAANSVQRALGNSMGSR